MNDKLKFKKLDEKAVLPTRGSSHAAALDLYSIDDTTISAGSYGAAHTGVAVEIPLGYYGRIAGRSGLAAKNGINTIGGVVDSDYRGELIVLLANHSGEDFSIKAGDRVAQFVIEAIITPEPMWAEELSSTERDTGGFGSTGHN